MAIQLDYPTARGILESAFREVEATFAAREEIRCPDQDSAVDAVFASHTQAYREVLLGCIVARSLNARVDVRLPYVNLGERAFNGRTLDEQVINPFLHDKEIPSSRGPYLAVFRRSVAFVPKTREGIRDKQGFDNLLAVLSEIGRAAPDRLREYLRCTLAQFLALRENSRVTLVVVPRLSLSQLRQITTRLLSSASGGRFPVMLVIALLKAVNEVHERDWTIEHQGINEADAASGAGGDITVLRRDDPVLGIEVTERPVDRSRVVSTFRIKISRSGIKDYLFVLSGGAAAADAVAQAESYFTQGYEVNFAEILPWLVNVLAALGSPAREAFHRHLFGLLDAPDTPRVLKVAWNQAVQEVIQ